MTLRANIPMMEMKIYCPSSPTISSLKRLWIIPFQRCCRNDSIVLAGENDVSSALTDRGDWPVVRRA